MATYLKDIHRRLKTWFCGSTTDGTLLRATYRNNIHRRLELVLVEEQRRRSTRKVDEWVLAERRKMLDAVNAERASLGKGPLQLADVERVERNAMGSFDYTHKFALYCAELVESP